MRKENHGRRNDNLIDPNLVLKTFFFQMFGPKISSTDYKSKGQRCETTAVYTEPGGRGSREIMLWAVIFIDVRPVFSGLFQSRLQPARTTIFPPALFSSIQRCASTLWPTVAF